MNTSLPSLFFILSIIHVVNVKYECLIRTIIGYKIHMQSLFIFFYAIKITPNPPSIKSNCRTIQQFYTSMPAPLLTALQVHQMTKQRHLNTKKKNTKISKKIQMTKSYNFLFSNSSAPFLLLILLLHF